MTETGIKNSSSKKLLVVIVTIVIAALGAAYYVGGGTITDKIAEEKVREFGNLLTSNLQKTGQEASLTYQSVHVERDGFKQRIVLVAPHIQIKEGAQAIDLTTDKMFVYPENPMFTALKFEIPTGVTVAPNSLEKSVFSYKTPLTIGVKTDTGKLSALDVRVPGNVEYSHVKLTQEGEKTTEQKDGVFHISMQDPAIFQANLDDGGNVKNIKVAVHDLSSVDAEHDQFALKVKEISMNASADIPKDGKADIHYNVTVADVALPKEIPVPGLLGFTTDFTLSGDLPKGSPADSDSAEEAKLNLKNFALKAGDTEIKASGTLEAAKGEQLPLAMVTISLKDLPKLLDFLQQNKILDAGMLSLVDKFSTQITGKKMTEANPLLFIIKREKGESAFHIGNTTFEGLFTTFLQSKSTPPAEEGAAPITAEPSPNGAAKQNLPPVNVAPAEPPAREQKP